MKLLTIAIPTYNRAAKVRAQCERLLRQIEEARLNNDVDLLVSDNASSDDTKALLEPFTSKPGYRYFRNPKNVGLVGNYIRCLELSESRFTWVVGDDDEIHQGAIADVAIRLRRNPELKVLFLNFRTKSGATGEMDPEAYYPPYLTGQFSGEEAAQNLLDKVGHSAWLWITGSVLSSATAIEAIRHSGSPENMAVPLMVSMYATCTGRWEVAENPSVTMIVGTTSWAAKYYRRVCAIDLPRVLFRLRRVGHDFVRVPHFRRVLQQRWIALAGDLRRRGISSIVDFFRL